MLFFKKFFLKLFGSSGLRCSHAGRLSLVVVGMGHSFVAERGLPGHSGFSSHGTQAHLPRDVWDSPGRGTEPTSPAPAGRLQTSGPPGKFCSALKDVSPVGFESKVFHPSGAHLKSCGAWCGVEALCFSGRRSWFWVLIIDCHTGDGVYGEIASQPLLSTLWVFFFFFSPVCLVLGFVVVVVFSRRHCSIFRCRFAVSMGGDEFRDFLHYRLEPAMLLWFYNIAWNQEMWCPSLFFF